MVTETRTTVRHRVHRFLNLVTTPLVPADYLDLINPLRPGGDLRGRIVARRRETADAVSIEIRPGADWRSHVPGQHVRVGVDVNGVRHHRTYSLTSAPGGATITITPKRLRDGVVSTHLVEHARVGDLVHLSQATGEFHLPEDVPAKVLLITAGSGITPALGMLRAGLAAAADVVHVHLDATADDVIGGADVRGLAAAGRLRLIEHHSSRHGRLTPSELCALVTDWTDRQTWACGPAELLDALTTHWADHDLADHLHIERFTPPQRAVIGDGGLVSFSGSAIEVDVPAGQTLLEAGEQAGVLMPSGCRMGICHGCLTPLSKGAVRDVRTGAITTAPDGESLPIQTCINEAAGPCQLDR